MARSRIEVNKRIILDLNEEEAKYLRDLTQNWLGQPVEGEHTEHTEHRSAIWCELNNCLEVKQ